MNDKFAEVVYYSENIYLGMGRHISGAVAVRDKKILAADSKSGIEKYCNYYTKKIDFGNKLLMPGFIDGHTHMMSYIPKVDLGKACSIEECKQIIKDFYNKHNDLEIIIGEKWYTANWGGRLPDKYDIDSIISDIPFFATDLDLHMVWCNSKLLEKMNLSSNTISELDSDKKSMINVDSEGNPTGIIIDEMAMDVLNQYKAKDTRENVMAMYDVWTGYGVTAINAMDFYSSDNEIFKITKELEKEEKLNVRAFVSLDAAKADEESIDDAKCDMNTDMFRLNSLKAFMDGTGAGHTALMKRPYIDMDSMGNQYMTQGQLMEYIKLADKKGLAMHTHCCGNKAVAETLKVYRDAKESGIDLDERFSIEHCDTTSDEEVIIPSQLGISLNLTPDFMAPTEQWKNNPYLKVYDEETKRELWRIKSFIDTGVNVSFGTDYTASSMNPFDQIYRAVERVANDGNPHGGYRPEEKISIETAIYCYTMGSARSIGMKNKLGSIDVGKYADMIVLDTNIFSCTPMELKNTKVLCTMINGKLVLDRRNI